MITTKYLFEYYYHTIKDGKDMVFTLSIIVTYQYDSYTP